ncbi:NLR family CARD domain-containing protein 3 [Anabarilius grahami]|uniref:NLR family CARD domain-containing protein 3 n=1 Tax=Anabarilius grahami TaxID=495550 RepID=A0A3N0XSG3_ANAGA|nr:NLR family CARD domain-containing protein 3 [Anabarilius grahami]
MDSTSKMSFHDRREEVDVVDLQNQRSGSPEPTCVPMKSDESMREKESLKFSDGAVASDPVDDQTGDLQHDSHQPKYELQRVKDQHKTSMKNKYESLLNGLKLQENQTFLKRFYTQHCIIEDESEGVNEEHEVLHMERTARTQHSQDNSIYCNDIFKGSLEPGCEDKDKTKAVLTKGIAGIGKTVSVAKFVLDWAEGKANQDVDFMFVLPFRELDLIGDHQYSLYKLLLDFHPELKDLNSKIYEECKVVFIFDGLDESRITLMFSDSAKVSDVTETSSVGLLISNLMKGELLPSALIWITSRPAAANQIPSRYINRVTEIHGFNEPQKEEYFRKRISDEHQATKIISHIRRARSLHIMCNIPVFCWISSTVFQNILKQDDGTEIPQTLTEMYIQFLLIQINMRNQKYEERNPQKLMQSNREMIVKLGELAFKQLMKGNVMFYEEDLRESGIDVTDSSVYFGICAEIFKEESVIHQKKVYSFIHLSFQEFLAAFYVFYSHLMKNMEPLQCFLDDKYKRYRSKKNRTKKISQYELLKLAVDKTLWSKNGHLDVFLRFFLGITVESNQRLLQDLLTNTENNFKLIKAFARHIKDTIKGCFNISADKSINLFLCLLEMNDQTLYREIQEFLKSDKELYPSPSLCSAIAYMIQMSEDVLDEFDLMKYNIPQEDRWRLMPAVINCRKALLSSALQSNSHLRDLNLSFNDLQDSGVKMLSVGMKSSLCQLNILRLVGCCLSDQSCESLSSVLQSSNSNLRELDLSNNCLHDSGVKLLSTGLKSSHCQLNILRLSGCMVTEEGCRYVSSALNSNPSLLRELDLSYNHPGESGVKLLTDTLNHPNCTLEKLNVEHGGEFRITAGLHKYACDLTLDPNTAHNNLILSEEYRKVTYVEECQSYPDHPERFDKRPHVLCGESLSGRCYWEAEWTGCTNISVACKGIWRKGKCEDTVYGFSKNSWCLACHGDTFYVWHSYKWTDTHVPSSSCKRAGVYLDVSAGTLSFYSISDTHTLKNIHTFTHTSFTEHLYAGFGFFVHPYNSSVSVCQIEKPVSNNTDVTCTPE